MNSLDNISLPPIFDGEDFDSEDEERLRARQEFFCQLGLLNAKNRLELKKRRMAAARDASSDSEVEEVTNGVKKGKMDVTPADSTPQELVKLDPAEVGMTVGLKYLYSGKEDKRGRFQWESKIPEDLGQPAEDAETQKLSIIVRKVKVWNDPTKVLTLHSVVIQSPLLKDLLKEVLAGYPGVTVNLKRLEFSGRFEPLIHRYQELNQALVKLRLGDEAEAKTKAEHAELLQKLLEEEFKDTIDASMDLKSQGVMTYEHLWTLFQPGSLVYSKQQGQDRIFKLMSSRYGQDRNMNPCFWLTCQYVDYDGTRFGTQKLNVKIAAYDGTKSINSFQSYPLEYHNSKEDLKAKLIERGGKVESFAGCHYRAYHGVGWRTDSMGNRDSQFVKGRVVIDTYGWNRFNPNYSIFVQPLHVKETRAVSGLGGLASGEDEYESDYDDYDDDNDGMPLDGLFADEEDEETKQKNKLNDEHKMMCTPLVRGYAFKEKMWLNFFVNAVQDISFNESAFDSLVLPSNKKELIHGFIETHQNHMTQFDDVIQGKGRGIILLLCGPPGVGKTLTAESVAEEMKVPLYQMSAGDLGLDPRHVESKLQGVLDMCTRWNALLLLDEADVFLEERSLHELERNKLVSIFLRVLEYYEGIMFLTTNRVQTFDQAFQSRIHISLEYKELDLPSRKSVWLAFLKQHNIAQAAARERPPKVTASAAKSQDKSKAKGEASPQDEETVKQQHLARTLPHTMEESDVNKLARLQMNGRQIKNILKAAQMLATRKGEGLGFAHVEMVMDVTQHLHQTTLESERARASFFT
ncbi:uncharacterized protein LTR77_008774 [Saxophila tyrrhenica]|uniref:AAA+ ATPase domain-containing protein n=1 Tax=Saxophila tyrrhenica TaxID=1690608 RepID=A0AAV9P3W8_9PEZI|nr:hypothetical protein LTR77_008774 [Saxophila tyrrhenica]